MVVQVRLHLSLTLAQVDSVQGGAAFFLFSLISARGGAVHRRARASVRCGESEGKLGVPRV